MDKKFFESMKEIGELPGRKQVYYFDFSTFFEMIDDEREKNSAASSPTFLFQKRLIFSKILRNFDPSGLNNQCVSFVLSTTT